MLRKSKREHNSPKTVSFSPETTSNDSRMPAKGKIAETVEESAMSSWIWIGLIVIAVILIIVIILWAVFSTSDVKPHDSRSNDSYSDMEDSYDSFVNKKNHINTSDGGDYSGSCED